MEFLEKTFAPTEVFRFSEPLLFIDVDDTLVKWKGFGDVHPYGANAEEYDIREDIKEFAKNWCGYVIVWSGGGAWYANHWATKTGIRHHYAVGKDYRVVKPTDVVIDDSFIAITEFLIHPSEISW